MKNDKCLEELRNIIEIEGISGRDGVSARRSALDRWIGEWVVELKCSQPIIKSVLTSEEEDFVKYYMAYRLGEELMEECVEVDSTNNILKTRVKALRR